MRKTISTWISFILTAGATCRKCGGPVRTGRDGNSLCPNCDLLKPAQEAATMAAAEKLDGAGVLGDVRITSIEPKIDTSAADMHCEAMMLSDRADCGYPTCGCTPKFSRAAV